MRLPTVVATGALLLVLAGCAGADDAEPAARVTETVTVTESAEPGLPDELDDPDRVDDPDLLEDPGEPAGPDDDPGSFVNPLDPAYDPDGGSGGSGGGAYDLSWDLLPRGTAPLDVTDHDTTGFTSPSGNIACLLTSDPYEVRCDRRSSTEQVPPPGDCQQDYGNAISLRPSHTGELLCVGDTVFGIAGETDGSRTLPYGDSVMFGRLVCTSGEQGVQCLDDGGGGFLISRSQVLF